MFKQVLDFSSFMRVQLSEVLRLSLPNQSAEVRGASTLSTLALRIFSGLAVEAPICDSPT